MPNDPFSVSCYMSQKEIEETAALDPRYQKYPRLMRLLVMCHGRKLFTDHTTAEADKSCLLYGDYGDIPHTLAALLAVPNGFPLHVVAL